MWVIGLRGMRDAAKSFLMPRPCLLSGPAVEHDASVGGDWSGSGWPQLTGCIHFAVVLTVPNNIYEVLRSKFSK